MRFYARPLVFMTLLMGLAAPTGAQSLQSHLQLIRSADGPDDAAAAYRTALRNHRGSTAVREAFVATMIELDRPLRASSAARLLVTMDEDNSTGWAGIVLTHVKQKQHLQALTVLAEHIDRLARIDALDEPAGQLVAWYREYRRRSPRAGAIARKVAEIRLAFGSKRAFEAAYENTIEEQNKLRRAELERRKVAAPRREQTRRPAR